LIAFLPGERARSTKTARTDVAVVPRVREATAPISSSMLGSSDWEAVSGRV
jgi:hypothetical protein